MMVRRCDRKKDTGVRYGQHTCLSQRQVWVVARLTDECCSIAASNDPNMIFIESCSSCLAHVAHCTCVFEFVVNV